MGVAVDARALLVLPNSRGPGEVLGFNLQIVDLYCTALDLVVDTNDG